MWHEWNRWAQLGSPGFTARCQTLGFQLDHYPAVWPWVYYWISLNLGLFIKREGMILLPHRELVTIHASAWHLLGFSTHILLGDPALLLSHTSVMSQLPSLGAAAQPFWCPVWVLAELRGAVRRQYLVPVLLCLSLKSHNPTWVHQQRRGPRIKWFSRLDWGLDLEGGLTNSLTRAGWGKGRGQGWREVRRVRMVSPKFWV